MGFYLPEALPQSLIFGENKAHFSFASFVVWILFPSKWNILISFSSWARPLLKRKINLV